MENWQINALVAEKIMGWERWTCDDLKSKEAFLQPPGTEFVTGTWYKVDVDIPLRDYSIGTVKEYSTNIKAAWEVVEKLAQMGYDVKINRLIHWNTDYECLIGKDNWVDMDYKYVGSDTAPMAICLAALKAVGVEVEGEK
jgi:hypothetical protein